ncbi:MAG: LPS assembly lipoprotein LptE [Acidobacteriota bacterium]|nr:LPS assembly lipoprotein LptE [Acidobacteriota bacterium]
MKLRYLILLLAAVLTFFECGYRLRGTGSFLPAHVQKMSIPMFKNSTTRFELDLKLTRSVISEMVIRGKVQVVQETEGADALLDGEIVSFRVSPIAFTEQAAADRYNIRIVARIALRDLVRQRVIFSDASFVFTEEYEVPEGSDFESVESEAIDKVAEKFARSLVVSILEGF